MNTTRSQVSRYRNRKHAGEVLADHLLHLTGRADLLVLALPRGGVPVASEVASRLDAPMDLMMVRKLGLPGHEELAIGAIATGGVRVINHEVVNAMSVSEAMINSVAEQELDELRRREQAYRGDRQPVEVGDRTVILVDDGLATGSTMRAAIQALQARDAAAVVVAVPVAPPDTAWRMAQEVDEFVCPLTPTNFMSVGQHYDRFDQTTDEEVRQLLGSTHPTDELMGRSGPSLRGNHDRITSHYRRDY